jgi:hypothetical protein
MPLVSDAHGRFAMGALGAAFVLHTWRAHQTACYRAGETLGERPRWGDSVNFRKNPVRGPYLPDLALGDPADVQSFPHEAV